MDNLLKYASEFESLTKNARRGRKPKRQRSRKDVEKDLNYAKKQYGKSKTDVSEIKKQIAKLQKDLERAEGDMNDARDTIMNSHKVMKGMDLSGASAVHGEGADVSYVVDNKKYDISFSDDGSFSLVPFSSRKKDSNNADDKKSETADENQADDLNYTTSDWTEDIVSLLQD